MVRELAIFLFLFVFKCVFSLFNFFPLKDKTTFVVSFGDNSKYVFEEMCRQNIDNQVVFLCKGKSISLFSEYERVRVIPFESYNILHWIKSVYHLGTSKHIMVDNYFGFLAAIKFRPGVECIQLWHASGALKKFGLEDESIKFRGKKAKQRFLQVYDKFDKVVVGSDVMAEIFMKSFNLPSNRILTTGIPRTDFYFNERAKQKALQKWVKRQSASKGKKVILYAPTYRDHELNELNLQLNIEEMYQELGNEYILILRLHPAIKNQVNYTEYFQDFVVDCSTNHFDINELLIVADYLITDYSSIPFEFSLLAKPIIFFAYDLEEYKKNRGILAGFEENMPGPICKNTESIIAHIKNNQFDLTNLISYSEIWNKYSKGHSSQNLVQHMFPEKSLNIQQKRSV